MSVVQGMKDTLKKYLDIYDSLVNKNDILLKEADAKTWQFVSERQSGNKGQVGLFPTIQDATIILFWASYFILFYMMGTTYSILEGTSRHIFIAGSLATFISHYYSISLTILFLVLTIVYFFSSSYKAFMFFILFLLLTSLIQITINSTM